MRQHSQYDTITLQPDYDIRALLVQPPNKEVQCYLCKELALNSRECQQCQQLFCYSCIKSIVQSGQPCPNIEQCHSKQNMVIIMPRNQRKQAYQQLRIRCPNQNCKQILINQQLEQHLEQDCHYQMIQCDNLNCRRYLLRHKMNEHIDLCQKNLDKCDLCNYVYEVGKQHGCINAIEQQLQAQHKEITNIESQIVGLSNDDELWNRMIRLESNYKQHHLLKCVFDHKLSWQSAIFGICHQCGRKAIPIYHICNTCRSLFCLQCRPPGLIDGCCRLGHKLVQIQQQFGICSRCLKCSENKVESIWNDSKCGLDLCDACYLNDQYLIN